MKIAIFGDIHGNIEALRAAYVAARTAGAEKTYHLGDLGGYAPFVNEVTDFVIEHGIEGVQGNYDDAVANDREHCGCKKENPVQEEMANLSFEWTKAHVTPKTKEYLGSLPSLIRLNIEDKKAAIFHAAPHKKNLYWFEERPDRFFMEMAEKLDADIMIYGHTHKPYRKDISGKIFINAGSVGNPKDGDPRTCVAIIDITRDAVRSEFIRVAYEVGKTAAAIIESGLPGYFAEKLKKAE
jgi:putative phosphoesterase